MELIGKVFNNFKAYYNGINGATLTGAIDVIIVQQEDGSFMSSPFHVRFGKLGVLRSREKVVDIEINGEPVDIHMKLGESGEAFFVTESEPGTGMEIPPHLATSPIPPSLLEQQQQLHQLEQQDEHLEECGNDTLMGKRDDGLLTGGDGEALGSLNSSSFEGEAVVCTQLEVTYKPIDVDDNSNLGDDDSTTTTPASSPPQEEMPIDMTEEERKRWNKKRRKRRSQLRRKQLKEAAKMSSESEVGNQDEPGEVSTTAESADSPSALPDIVTTATQAATTNNRSKLGHRKTRSVSNVEIRVEEASSPEGRIDQWIQGNAIISRSLGPEFHFFSDTELDVVSADGSRPPTPIHSDTEYEVGQQRKNSSTGEGKATQSWRWGELPSPPVIRPSALKPVSRPVSRDTSPVAGGDDNQNAENSTPGVDGADAEHRKVLAHQTTTEEESQRSMLGHMFSLLRQTKKIRNQAALSGGIYLDDFNELDPELAALYLPQSSFRQGLVQSVPTNFHPRLKDEDTESGNGLSLPQSPHSMSVMATMERSGGPQSVDSDFEDLRHDFRHLPDVALSLCGAFNDLPEPPEELFLQSLVTYDDFVENPRLIENPDLLVRIGTKYYTWQAACPIIMSWALYRRPLPPSTIDGLVRDYMPKREKKKLEVIEKQSPTTQPKSSYSSWLPWRRAESKKSIEPQPASSANETEDATEGTKLAAQPTEVENSVNVTPEQRPDLNTGTSSDNESDSTQPDASKKLPMDKRPYYENTDVFCKTLRLTSDQINKLNLREGANEAVFSVTTAYQGTTRCKCHIYLWRYDDKVVISDIDGTITKSDVLGHILPIVGQDWAQSGVAQLFTKIKNNGYRILYLSARAIGQARITRDYLRSVKQGDLSLPDGPLLLNPTSLLSALHREVIEKKPEEFKISCLRDIQALFPQSSNPFYAGYGNKVNDVWAYCAVGIPTSRIFTINPRGELKLELTQTFQSSYSKQSFIVDLVFPPLSGSGHEAVEGAEYNEFIYWKEPVVELPDDADQFIKVYAEPPRNRHSSHDKK